MDAAEIFSSKAEKYARYRWDYAPQAIQRIFEITGIDSHSLVADIGAGTGISARNFIGRCGQVYAIEPNGPMRALMAQSLGLQALGVNAAGYLVCDGRAEATGLPDHSLDLISVAQALNWFDPLPARAEFRRILKQGGWLAAVRNVGTYGELDAALESVYPKETDTAAWMKGIATPVSFYYAGDFIRESFFFSEPETWDEFFGSLATASYAPDEGSALWSPFEQAARQVFDRFSKDGVVISQVETRLCLGRMEI